MQTWNIPIDSTDLLSDSRVDINDALASLQTNYAGTADPAGAVLVDNIIWINTTSNKLKGRKAGATFQLGDWDTEMGHIRKDGSIAFTSHQSMGNFRLENLAAPTADSHAARKQDVDARVAKTGDIMSAALTFSGMYDTYIPAAGAAAAASMSQVNAKVPLTGGDLTGALTYNVSVGSLLGASVRTILHRDDIEDLVTFNTTAGHRHTGVLGDARAVRIVDLAAIEGVGDTNILGNKILKTIGNGTVSVLLPQPVYNPKTTFVTLSTNSPVAFTQINVAASTRADAYAILVTMANSSGSPGHGNFRVNISHEAFTVNVPTGETVQFIIPLDTSNQTYEWNVTSGLPNVTIKMIGFFGHHVF